MRGPSPGTTYMGSSKLPDALRSLFHPLELREIQPNDRIVVADWIMDHEGERLVVFHLPGDARHHTLPFPRSADPKIKRRNLWVLIPASTEYQRDTERASPLDLLAEAKARGTYRSLLYTNEKADWTLG